MITYCYYCPGCGHEWEERHGVDDRNSEKCPECGTNARIDLSRVRLQISCFDKLYPVKITDLTPYPKDEHWVRSKREHKELFKRYGKESPAFM